MIPSLLAQMSFTYDVLAVLTYVCRIPPARLKALVWIQYLQHLAVHYPHRSSNS